MPCVLLCATIRRWNCKDPDEQEKLHSLGSSSSTWTKGVDVDSRSLKSVKFSCVGLICSLIWHPCSFAIVQPNQCDFNPYSIFVLTLKILFLRFRMYLLVQPSENGNARIQINKIAERAGNVVIFSQYKCRVWRCTRQLSKHGAQREKWAGEKLQWSGLLDGEE